MAPRPTKSQKVPGKGSAATAAAATPGTPSAGGAAHAGSSQTGGTPAPEEGPQITPGGTYTLQQVIVGCKVFVQKPDPATGEIEERQAEILSMREKPKPKRKLDTGTGASKDVEEVPMEERLEYYVHYSEFNKRLDEWVPGKRLITSRDMLQPAPAAPAHGHGSQSSTTNSRKKTARPSVPGTPGTPTPSARNMSSSGNLLKKAALAAAQEAGISQLSQDAAAANKARAGSAESDEESLTGGPATPKGDVEMSDGTMAGPNAVGEDAAVVSMEMVGDADAEGDDEPGTPGVSGPTTSLHPNARPQETFSKAAEIEKLRTSGSMTQSVHEVSRVKNLNRIIMGAHEIETWYFSPYPVEYAHLDVLYVCEMCLGYFPSSFLMTRHRKKCGLVHPPGNEIYRHEDISFFEIDGRRQKTWCRNLCLLSKCFLDHKTLYYDVDPFLYYIMAQRDDAGVHIIGYFSKEKESAENYNVACILTLPQHQRAGFGKLLIEFSYELTKREHKLGSPEKPLSDLGLLGYRAYWAEIIVEVLLRTEEEISIDEIANRTAIVHADILHTCTALNMLKHYQGKHYLVLNDAVLQNHEKQVKKKRRRIVPERLNWEPPKFSRDQLRFGW